MNAPHAIRPSEITPERAWHTRRAWLKAMAATAFGPAAWAAEAEAPTPYEAITRHNNYYEFTPDKSVVWKVAEEFRPRPWTLAVDGECERPRRWDLDELLTGFAQQDRTYRLRCIEGWSMVVPWRGFALAELLAQARPTSRARYVEFVSEQRSTEMYGQRRSTMPWPYREGLRIDEAMHPLTLMVTGLYGKPLPNQNGAPLRLAVPWKYGFKSPKAIVRIRFVQEQPTSFWMRLQPGEYGFYGNVNPDVAHPRWSQRRETRIGEMGKRATLPFNGYADQVASLYAGLDLATHF